MLVIAERKYFLTYALGDVCHNYRHKVSGRAIATPPLPGTTIRYANIKNMPSSIVQIYVKPSR